MTTAAAKPPNVNAGAIVNNGLKELGFLGESSFLTAFGINIESRMTVVPGRILRAPGIRYGGQGQPAIDDRASWNLKKLRFFSGAKLDNWAVLLVKDGNKEEFTGINDPLLLSTVEKFADMCIRCGMKVARKKPRDFIATQVPCKDRSDPLRTRAILAIRACLEGLRSKPELLLVILSNGDKHIYAGIKHLCDLYLDVATVCVHAGKIRREKAQYFANVALKVNMKMGGTNHQLDTNNMRWLLTMPTMLVGIDVTHPGHGSVKGTPSFAAVVASIDDRFGQYLASMAIQKTKMEMVKDLSTMMYERLRLYQEKNKKLPLRVLVYRDGVSEGQFSIVVDKELYAIKQAFREFDAPESPYVPQLTIVICGKRHNTRFYPTEKESADSNSNPKAGTVVDRGVTAYIILTFSFKPMEVSRALLVLLIITWFMTKSASRRTLSRI